MLYACTLSPAELRRIDRCLTQEHRTMLRITGGAHADHPGGRVLWRREGADVLIRTPVPLADTSSLVRVVDASTMDRVEAGECTLRLRAAPSVKRSQPGRANSRREALSGFLALDWFARQAELAGMRVLDGRIGMVTTPASRDARGVRFNQVDYEARVSVEDVGAAAAAIAAGIGPCRAWGCGLAVLVP